MHTSPFASASAMMLISRPRRASTRATSWTKTERNQLLWEVSILCELPAPAARACMWMSFRKLQLAQLGNPNQESCIQESAPGPGYSLLEKAVSRALSSIAARDLPHVMIATCR